MRTLVIFFDKDNDSNKAFFNRLKGGKGLRAMIFPKLEITSKTLSKINPDFIAKQLGVENICLNLIDEVLFDKFVLVPELGTEFREENGKIIFWKNEQIMTFKREQILKIADRMSGGKILWEQK